MGELVFMTFFLYFLFCIVTGAFCSFVGKEKGRGEGHWFFLGFFFNFVALIAIAGLPKLETQAERVERERLSKLLDWCPNCKERVNRLAVVCPHCHCSLVPTLTEVAPEPKAS